MKIKPQALLTDQKRGSLLKPETLNIWSFDKDGNKVHPYKGEKGNKKGLYCVNSTNNTKKFQGYSELQLIIVMSVVEVSRK